MELFYRKSGQGKPLVILHGLFGSSDNWYTLAKTFAEHFTVYLVDQRNHGQSPHNSALDYAVLTEDLKEFMDHHRLERAVLLGHSMGGKTTMNFTVCHPDRVQDLIIVDIVPKEYPVHHDHILEGLKSISLPHLNSRSEADDILSRFVPEPDVRQFLLKNLARKSEGGFEWKINLDAIERNIEAMGEGMVFPGSYEGSTLFLMGSRSNYYLPGDEKLIKKIFPAATIQFLDTGHWVQAERPAEFAEAVLKYLAV